MGNMVTNVYVKSNYHWLHIDKALGFRQEAQLLLGDRATRKHAKDC